MHVKIALFDQDVAGFQSTILKDWEMKAMIESELKESIWINWLDDKIEITKFIY